MKVLSTLLMVFLIASICTGQTAFDVSENASPLETVQLFLLPNLDNDQLKKTHTSRNGKTGPLTFAIDREVNLHPGNSGNWEYLDNGKAIWRIRLKSPGAKSINLGFTQFSLPPQAKIILYPLDRSLHFGPFESRDNRDRLWTPIIPGDEVVVELQIQLGDEGDVRLLLAHINHDFIGIGNVLRSGSCNLDVVCGTEEGWEMVDQYRDIIRSSGMYSIQGTDLCSGALINNSMEDGTPYFLTADHCGISNANDASVVIYWNYENDFCRQPNSPASGAPGNGQLTEFNTGVILRASYGPSDFALVELEEEVVASNAFYSGWNKSSDIPQNAIGIHHPNTEEKRISFDFDALELDGTTHLRVDDWDIGTTEGGSSGSPLYNDEKQIVGQLTGGFAACGNNEWDSYGWINASWEGGGSANSRLKDWLDPLNSGIESLNGKEGGLIITLTPGSAVVCVPDTLELEFSISANFIADTDILVGGLPSGVSVMALNNTLSPGDTTTITLIVGSQVQPGNYSISIFASDGTNDQMVTFELDVFGSIPDAPILNEPPNKAENANVFSIFEWEETDVETYHFQISHDSLFTELLVDQEGLEKTNFQSSELEEELLYYWRVRGKNGCGFGTWSETYSFITGILVCQQNASTNVPLLIGSGQPNTIESKLIIPFDGEILDLNVVDVMGSHDWIEDLTFSLKSPAGTTITLVSEVCGDQRDFFITFDDQASTIPPCPYTDGGAYLSLQPLSIFNGENTKGIWRLIVQDGADEDGGTLDSWNLEFCLKGATDYSLTVNPIDLAICPGDTASFELDLGISFDSSSTSIILMAPPGIQMDVNTLTDRKRIIELFNFDLFSSGTYNFTFIVDDGSGMNEFQVEIEIQPLPDRAVLFYPENESIDIEIEPILMWENGGDTDSVMVELSREIDFSQILFSIVTDSDSLVSPVPLEALSQYFWRVTAFNDCGEIRSDIYSFTTEESTGIQSAQISELKIYPNPASQKLTISLSDIQITDFYITGISGDLMLEQHDLKNPDIDIYLLHWPPGLYLIKVISEQGSISRKFVVK